MGIMMAKYLTPTILLAVGAASPTVGADGSLPAGAIRRISPASKISLASGLHYSPDGKAIFCPTNDDALAVFDPTTGRLVHSLRGPSRITQDVNGAGRCLSLYSSAGLGAFSP